MKTIQEIKEIYAIEQGFADWEELQCDCQRFCDEMEMHMDEICIRAQKEALENAAENSWIDSSEFSICGCKIDRNSITHPENLVR